MSPPVLTSLQNPRIKEAVRLLERRARKRTGRTRIDGARELLRALDGGVIPEVLFHCDELVRPGEGEEALRRCADAGVPLQPVSREVSEKLAFGDRREGLCAVVAWAPRSIDALHLPARPLLLVLTAIEKPGNLGALLRTADAAGVDAVLCCDPVTDPANPNAVRASLGTLFTVPVAQASVEAARSWLLQRGVKVVTLRPEAAATLWDTDLTGPLAIVVGAEAEGLESAFHGAGMHPVRIPMAGRADSLNVAACAAVVLFEARRQRAAGG